MPALTPNEDGAAELIAAVMEVFQLPKLVHSVDIHIASGEFITINCMYAIEEIGSDGLARFRHHAGKFNLVEAINEQKNAKILAGLKVMQAREIYRQAHA